MLCFKSIFALSKKAPSFCMYCNNYKIVMITIQNIAYIFPLVNTFLVKFLKVFKNFAVLF